MNKIQLRPVIRVVLAALALLIVPAAHAQFNTRTNNGTITITGYTDTNVDVDIPGTINGLPVTSIGEGAFSSDYISSVVIPGGVTNIGYYAFSDCFSLTNVTIPDGMLEIDEFAFENCGLTNVFIPASLTNIEVAAFVGCDNLTAINVDTNNPVYSSIGGVLFSQGQSNLVEFPDGLGGNYAIPAGVTSIRDWSFAWCGNLTGVSIPNTVTNIGVEAFYDCYQMPSITIPASVSNIEDLAFIACGNLRAVYFLGNPPNGPADLFEYDLLTVYYLPGTTGWAATLGGMPTAMVFNCETNSGAITIAGYAGGGGAVTIPDSINGLPVTGIGDGAFYNCTNLTGITIPGSVTSIGDRAFYGCADLASLNISNGVTSIGEFAFGFCTSLNSVTFPDSLASIGDYAFAGCESLNIVTMGTGISNIGEYAFSECYELEGVYFPAGPPNADSTAFAYDYYFTKIYILPQFTGWGSYFGGVPTEELVPFTYTSATADGTITITSYNSSVWNPGTDMFEGAPSLAIPATIDGVPVTGIGAGAFYADIGLANVSIPATVTNIGLEAFALCGSLSAITVDPQNQFYTSVNGVLFDKNENNLIEYPAWVFGDSYTIPGTVTNIDAGAFAYTHLGTVTIPASVTGIGAAAFLGCSNVSGLYFLGNPPNLANRNAFAFDNSATAYYLPGTTGWAPIFDGLPTALIPFTYDSSGGGITITGFAGQGSEVTIPGSINGLPVTGIADFAFANSSLTNVILPDTITSIGDDAFLACASLTNVIIPDSVTNIGGGAFAFCANLACVSIGTGVSTIGDDAFADCPKLTGVYIHGNAPGANASAFESDPDATVYYFPGTTGWTATYDNLPAVLWNPQALDTGMRSNLFGFTIKGNNHMLVVVEGCTDLTEHVWIPLATNTLTGGSSYFCDQQSTNYPSRFYRFRSP